MKHRPGMRLVWLGCLLLLQGCVSVSLTIDRPPNLCPGETVNVAWRTQAIGGTVQLLRNDAVAQSRADCVSAAPCANCFINSQFTDESIQVDTEYVLQSTAPGVSPTRLAQRAVNIITGVESQRLVFPVSPTACGGAPLAYTPSALAPSGWSEGIVIESVVAVAYGPDVQTVSVTHNDGSGDVTAVLLPGIATNAFNNKRFPGTWSIQVAAVGPSFNNCVNPPPPRECPGATVQCVQPPRPMPGSITLVVGTTCGR